MGGMPRAEILPSCQQHAPGHAYRASLGLPFSICTVISLFKVTVGTVFQNSTGSVQGKANGPRNPEGLLKCQMTELGPGVHVHVHTHTHACVHTH